MPYYSKISRLLLNLFLTLIASPFTSYSKKKLIINTIKNIWGTFVKTLYYGICHSSPTLIINLQNYNLINSFMLSSSTNRSLKLITWSMARLILESDERYRDISYAHKVCEHLNQVNAHDLPSVPQEAECLPSQPINQVPRAEPCQILPVDSFLNFLQGPLESLIDSEDSTRSQGILLDERQTAPIQPSTMDYEDSGGAIQNQRAQVEQMLLEQDRHQDENEVSSQSSGNSRDSQRLNSPPSYSQLSRQEKAYNKNLVCYIAKSVRRMMFGKFRNEVTKRCEKSGVSFQEFDAFCNLRKFNGVNALVLLLTEDKNESASQRKMRNIFKNLFQKILRRAYLRTAINEGKMMNLQAYIDFKNKYLLYLDQLQKK